MRFATVSGGVIAAAFTATAALAGQHGHAAPPHATVPHAHTTTTHGVSTHTSTTHGSSTTHATRSTTHGKTTHATAHTTHTKTTRTTTTTTTTTAGSSPIAAKIESHPQLASKLTALLPQGMTLDEAAAGFRNQGQFIAALHVSQNLGIPFADLKQEMVTNHSSLGQSIQKLRPEADATSAAHEGEVESDQDLGTTGGTTSTTTTTKPKHGKGR